MPPIEFKCAWETKNEGIRRTYTCQLGPGRTVTGTITT